MSESNQALVMAAVQAFNDPDQRERYLDLYAPDVKLHGLPGNVQGRDGLRRFSNALWEAFPDVRVDVHELLAGDDRVAARFGLAGTQSADFYGAPVSGRQTELEGVIWLHLRDGLVVEAWQLSGSLEMLTRLSARAAKAPPRPSASAAAAALRWEEQHPTA